MLIVSVHLLHDIQVPTKFKPKYVFNFTKRPVLCMCDLCSSEVTIVQYEIVKYPEKWFIH